MSLTNLKSKEWGGGTRNNTSSAEGKDVSSDTQSRVVGLIIELVIGTKTLRNLIKKLKGKFPLLPLAFPW